MTQQTPKQRAGISCAVVLCSMVLLILAAMMVFWGFVADMNVNLITTGLVTAFLGAWLSLRPLVFERGKRVHKSALSASVVTGIFALVLVAAGIALVVAIGWGRPFLKKDRTAFSREDKMKISLSPRPSDGTQGIDPDTEFLIEIEGAHFRDGFSRLGLMLADHGRQSVESICQTTDKHGRQIRCQPRTPLLFDTRYKANFTTTAYGKKGRAAITVNESWSFTTSSRYDDLRGIFPALIRIISPAENKVVIEGKAGALPAHAVASGWQVYLRDRGSLRLQLPVRADGSFGDIVTFVRKDRLNGSRGFYLEITGATGEPVARLPLGPMVSSDGRTIHLVGQRPFRYLTPDGAIVVFDGDDPQGYIGSVLIQRIEDSCSHLLPPELGCAGTWKITHNVTQSGRFPPGGGVRAEFVRPSPAVEVLYPAPNGVEESPLFLDTTLGNIMMRNSGRRMFILHGIGRSLETGLGRFVSVREEFPVAGGGKLNEIDPSRIFNRDPDGTHHLLYARSNTVALVVGDYSGENGAGKWHVSSHSLVVSPDSRLNVAAPLPVYGASIIAREDRTLAILPVIAEQPFDLLSIDPLTGWVGGNVHFEGVDEKVGTIQFVGDLDRLQAAKMAKSPRR